MRIIIAGSRSFDDYGLLCRECNKIIGEYKLITADFEIVAGGASGADKLAEWYALDKNYKLNIMKADWDKYGRGAGYIRNEQMAKYTRECPRGMLIAFHDGESRGTKNMIDVANKYNLKVHVIKFEPESIDPFTYKQPKGI